MTRYPSRVFILITLLTASQAHAVDYLLDGETSCLGLPWSGSWDAVLSICTVSADVTVSSADTLTIESPAMLKLPDGFELNNSGIFSIPIGGRLWISGPMNNNAGGEVLNSGFWTIRDGALLTNAATGKIVNNNQLDIASGTFDNAGTFESNASLSISNGQVLMNSGAITNNSSIVVRGTLTNSGSIDNQGSIQIDCGLFTNTGTLTGNPVMEAWCWVGSTDEFWSTTGNWNLTGVPPSDADVVIPSGRPPAHVNSALTISGAVEIELNDLVVDAAGTLTSSGTISLQTGSPGTSVLQVDGVFVNNGIVSNRNRIANNGTVTNNNLIGPTGGTGQFFNDGTFNNVMSAEFQGGLENGSTGLVENAGHFELNRSLNGNAGFINNFVGAVLKIDNVLANTSGGELHNSGSVNVTDDLSNPGRLENAVGALIVNELGATLATTSAEAQIANDGRIDNEGLLDNIGIVQNDGQICGGGTFTGNPILGTPVGVACEEIVFTSSFEDPP
jgi:hypothetical protein